MKTTYSIDMRNSLILVKAIALAVLLGAFNQSCTDLDEELYSEVTPDNFFKTDEEILAGLGAAYTQFGNWASGDPFTLQTITSDEVVVPTRGQDWDDGGAWRRWHLHSWTREDGALNGGWSFGYSGVTTCNRLIYQFQFMVDNGTMEPDVAEAYIAELRAVRGFFYWQLIDMFGNVPLVTTFITADPFPATVDRADVYNWLVADLEEVVPQLPKVVDASTYGRMNYYAGKMLLAKLYLNAKQYSGSANYEAAVAACDEIINSGLYSLESNYFANFDVENSASKEFIFTIPFDEVYFTGFNLAARTLHYASQYTYNLAYQPWNGFCSLEEFYNSYEDEDLRKGDPGTLEGRAVNRGNFIAGYQYNADGTKALDAGAGTDDPDGELLNFGSIGSGEPQINELGPNALRQAGVRIGKWEIGMNGEPNMSNDYAIFRYADVLLMKAEALWRLNSADPNVLPLVNQIRARAGVADLTTVDGPVSFDMDGGDVPGGELLNEIGREMFAENGKRQALIRWELFDDVNLWALPIGNPGDVIETGEHTYLFPIHRDKLDANPNLRQNPGYAE
ncbi:MAG: RagB/SusD family nutrient uptake outer membrane protein [Bacteroidetes bacterium]|nr:MAG: RagB/SusD family nutrient uptake outer membrane protein [Bacteroidota bacterium]